MFVYSTRVIFCLVCFHVAYGIDGNTTHLKLSDSKTHVKTEKNTQGAIKHIEDKVKKSDFKLNSDNVVLHPTTVKTKLNHEVVIKKEPTVNETSEATIKPKEAGTKNNLLQATIKPTEFIEKLAKTQTTVKPYEVDNKSKKYKTTIKSSEVIEKVTKTQTSVKPLDVATQTTTETTTAEKPTGVPCNVTVYGIIKNQIFKKNQSCYSPEDAMKCFHDPIFCEKYFLSGNPGDLSLMRPMYGEYSYLAHQHWFYIIQHGGIAFLFHPCTESAEINLLRNLATNCLHRHIIAPYNMLSKEFPIALISWGCYYLTSKVNVDEMKLWIQNHALKGPASHVTTNGQYNDNLVKHSKVITDKKDTFPCPNPNQRDMFSTTSRPQSTIKRKHDPERIILERLNLAEHKRDKTVVNISANITVTKVVKSSAAWAASSLFFLCAILLSWLIYTKYWSPSENKYKYKRLHSLTSEFEYCPGHSDFSMLKSNQKFISIFKKEKKTDSASKVHLMIPINEEDEEDEM